LVLHLGSINGLIDSSSEKDSNMSVRFPPKLIPGDLIAVTAPSSGVPQHLHPRLELAIGNLKKKGFRVREGKCLRLQYKNKSACKISRAKELMSYLTDPEIKAVMPPWGAIWLWSCLS